MASKYSTQSSRNSTNGVHSSASASRRSARLAQSAQSNTTLTTNNTSGVTNVNSTSTSDVIIIDSDSDLELEAGTQSEEYVPSDAETEVISDNEAEVHSDDEIVLLHTTGTARSSGTHKKPHCSMDCKRKHQRQHRINTSLWERVQRLERAQRKSLMDSSFKNSNAEVQSDKSAKLTIRLSLS